MQSLADSKCSKLEYLTISQWGYSFDGGDDCLDPLLVLLARQTELKTLTMVESVFDDAQQQIR